MWHGIIDLNTPPCTFSIILTPVRVHGRHGHPIIPLVPPGIPGLSVSSSQVSPPSILFHSFESTPTVHSVAVARNVPGTGVKYACVVWIEYQVHGTCLVIDVQYPLPSGALSLLRYTPAYCWASINFPWPPHTPGRGFWGVSLSFQCVLNPWSLYVSRLSPHRWTSTRPSPMTHCSSRLVRPRPRKPRSGRSQKPPRPRSFLQSIYP